MGSRRLARGLQLRPPSAAFDPSGPIRVELASEGGKSKDAGPRNEVTRAGSEALNVNRQAQRGWVGFSGGGCARGARRLGPTHRDLRSPGRGW